MIKSRLSGIVLSALLLSFSVAAVPGDKVIKPTRGVIDAVNGNTLQVTTRQGEKISVELTDNTKVNSVSQAKMEDIKPNSFIGTAAVPQVNGTLRALEVHVFSPELRGTGEGFNAFESADGKVNTMTNGTVGQLVNAHGRTMTVKYHDLEKTVIVPDDVPVVLIAPGNKSMLTAGMQVVLFSIKNDQNQWVARSISAGKDGLKPPM